MFTFPGLNKCNLLTAVHSVGRCTDQHQTQLSLHPTLKHLHPFMNIKEMLNTMKRKTLKCNLKTNDTAGKQAHYVQTLKVLHIDIH